MTWPCKKALEKLDKVRKSKEYRLCIIYKICPECGGDLIRLSDTYCCRSCKKWYDRQKGVGWEFNENGKPVLLNKEGI